MAGRACNEFLMLIRLLKGISGTGGLENAGEGCAKVRGYGMRKGKEAGFLVIELATNGMQKTYGRSSSLAIIGGDVKVPAVRLRLLYTVRPSAFCYYSKG